MNEEIAAWRREWGEPTDPEEQVEALSALFRILFRYAANTKNLVDIWTKSGFQKAVNTMLYVHGMKNRKMSPMVLCVILTNGAVAKKREAEEAELRSNIDAMRRQLDVLEQMARRDPSFKEEADVLRNKVDNIFCPTIRKTRATKKPS